MEKGLLVKEAKKGKEMIFPSDPPEETSPVDTMTLTQWNWKQQHTKNINSFYHPNN